MNIKNRKQWLTSAFAKVMLIFGGSALASSRALASERVEGPTQADFDALKSALKKLGDDLRETPPIGTIVMVAADLPAPKGYLLCDGKMYDVSKQEFSHLKLLLETIKSTWGGDGLNTFAVPELRGEFPRFLDKGRGVDPQRTIGTLQAAGTAMPTNTFITAMNGSHNHGGATGDESQTHTHGASGQSAQGGPNTFDDGDHRGVNGNVQIGANNRGHTHGIGSDGNHNHTITGGDTETRPRNHALVGYIKY